MLQESTKVMLPIEQKPLRGMHTLFLPDGLQRGTAGEREEKPAV